MIGYCLDEPELEFGGGGRHIDIRYGLADYGPFDLDLPTAPKAITVGLVGTAPSIERLGEWLTRCRDGLPARPSTKPTLFPAFPGFTTDGCFRSQLILDARLEQTIPSRRIAEAVANVSGAALVATAVDIIIEECRSLVERVRPAVLMCALPPELLEAIELAEETPDDRADDQVADEDAGDEVRGQAPTRLDLHDLLKARALSLQVPLQLVRPETYDPTRSRKRKRPQTRTPRRQLQDPATRAWNIHTAAYYKANGTPWRLLRNPAELTTCYVGVSFYRSIDGESLHTSVAQVFNERGDGVIVRGGQAHIDKDDRQPHLDAAGAAGLIQSALAVYRREHLTSPARVLIHKSSEFSHAEREGFRHGTEAERIGRLEMVSIRPSSTRLFRPGRQYPPLRGTVLDLAADRQVVYTRGSVDFFATYPGMYVPRPLDVRLEEVESGSRALAEEMLALTKMNWNSTQFDGDEPITMRAARQVGDVLRYTPADVEPPARYAFYM